MHAQTMSHDLQGLDPAFHVILEEYIYPTLEQKIKQVLETFVLQNEQRAREISLMERILNVEKELKAQRKTDMIQFRALEKRYTDLRKDMNARFVENQAAMNARFEDVQSNFNARFAENQAAMNARFEEIQSNFNARFESLEKRFQESQDNFNARFTESQAFFNTRFAENQANMNARFEAIDKRFDSLETRFDALTKRMDRFMIWSLGLTVTATFLIITVLR